MPTTLGFRKILLFMGDINILYLSLFGTVFFGFGGKFSWEIMSGHLLPFSILYFFWLIIFYIFGLYDLGAIRIRVVLYPKILGAILCGLGLGMVFFYLVPLFGITPKTNLLLNVLIFGVLFLIWRKLFSVVFSFRFFNNVAILSKDPQKIETLAKEIALRPYLGYKLTATFNDSKDLLAKIQEKKINALIVAEDFETDFDLLENLYQCLEARIIFLDWSQAYELFCEKIPTAFLQKKWFLENLKEGERKFYDKIKRGQDLILAAILLIVTSPLWPLIVLLIKLGDKGPVIYRQERIGKDRKPFLLLKFRSMNVEAESKTGPVWAKKEDHRVTKAGKLLRETHLDELPQMINVLKGDISLVGPRPERPEFVEKLEKEIPYYHVRHLIKPGFTGWAQLKFRYGRSVMDSKEKFQYDLYYLKNRSPLLDLGILLKTFQLFFKKEK
ncbi:MAG: sugar transferase [Candidatus Nealsonbacteria bacterium]